MSISIICKLSVPVAFFGYATFANVSLFFQDVQRPSLVGLTKGAFTQEVDTLYRDNLPHQEPAVGVVGAARYVLLNEGRKGVVAGERGWLFTSEEFRAQDLKTQQHADLLDWIAQSKQQLEDLGSQLVVVALPAKADVNADHIDAQDQVAQLQATYDNFLNSLSDLDIAHLGAKDALFSVDTPFFKTDTHWTLEGGIAVADAISKSGLIPLGEDSFEIVQQPKVTFNGDLVSFVTSEAMAPLVGLPKENISPYIAEPVMAEAELGGLDLFGDAGAAAISLVGTSYSANPNWSFAEALKVAIGTDVLNYAQEGRGPVAPMKDFMDSLDPASVPPYVIWEFPVRYLTDQTLLDSLVEKEDPNA